MSSTIQKSENSNSLRRPSSRVVDMADLKRESVRGGMATLLSQGITTAIHLVSTVTLARLLSPNDYGMIAMVMAVASFAGLFRDLGLSAAAIQKGTLNQAQMSNLFWLNVGMGAFLMMALAAASPIVAWFYEKPELIPLTALLSTTFLIGSLGTQHGALMQRELRFGRKAFTGIVGSLVTLIVAIILAIAGQTYWALAWGTIAGGIVKTALLFLLSPFRPGFWTYGAGVRSMLKFGANVTAFELVNYFHRNLDNILIGKFWGAAPLGFYSRAYSLLMFPIHAIRGPINAVAFPALSRLQDQPTAYRAYYRKITQLLAFTSMPLTAFLFVGSSPIVNVLFGAEWAGISPIFSILAITGFIQPVLSLWGVVLLSCGLGTRYFQLGLFHAVCVSLSFLAGVFWGPIGVATSYAVVTYLLSFPILKFAFAGTPVKPTDFFVSISRPLISSISSGTVLFVANEAVIKADDLLLTVLLGCLYFVAYLAIFAILPGGQRELSAIASYVYWKKSAAVNC